MTISTSTPKASGGPRIFEQASARGTSGRGKRGDLDIDGEAFEREARVCAASGWVAGLVAEHAVRALRPRRGRPRRRRRWRWRRPMRSSSGVT